VTNSSVGECKQFINIGFTTPIQLCCGSIYATAYCVHEKALVQVNVYILLIRTDVRDTHLRGVSTRISSTHCYMCVSTHVDHSWFTSG